MPQLLSKQESRLEGGRNQVTLLYESEAGLRVVHDRVCGDTYSFHPTGAVHLYPLSLMPAENDPIDSEAPVYYHKTNGYDTILFPQFGARKRLHKVVRPPSLAIRGVSRPVPPQ